MTLAQITVEIDKYQRHQYVCRADIKADLIRLGLGRYLLIADVPREMDAPRYRDTQMSTQLHWWH